MLKKIVVAVFAICLLIVAGSSWYVQDETQRAVVYQFGVLKYERTDAGLHGKLPWPIQSMNFLEKRYLTYHASPHEVLTKDKKALEIDTIAFYKIIDGMKYTRTVQTEQNASARLDDIAYSEMRTALGSRDLEKVVVNDRVQVMNDVTENSDKTLRSCCALNAAQVRVVRADFPDQNKQSVYDRMRAERGRIAAGYRSEGEEMHTKKVADTNREYDVMIAEANEEAQKTRGEGDAEAARIYNEAYNQDPKFFEFWRSLQTAEKTLGDGKAQFIENGQEPHIKVLFGEKK